MIIVDDRLARDVLAGRPPPLVGDQAVATTWGFQYRLVRALSDHRIRGRLSRTTPGALRAVAAAPPPSLLRVLDPREVTLRAAELASEHGLNLLAAELMAAAVVHDARLVLSAANVGRSWPEVAADLGVPLDAV